MIDWQCLPWVPRLGGAGSLGAVCLVSVSQMMRRRLTRGLQDVALKSILLSNKASQMGLELPLKEVRAHLLQHKDALSIWYVLEARN